ncbi:MAG: tetratricopeptide repeat protein [Bacteroidota bacterium]
MKEIDHILIQRYLDGDLTEKEKVEVESQLHLPSIQEYLEAHQTVTKGIQQYGEAQARRQVQQLEAEAVQEETNVPSTTKWLLRGVAASLLLLMVAFPLYWFQDEQRNGRIFNEHYQAYQALGGATRGESDADLLLPQAFTAYHEQDYAQAIELFIEVSTQEDRPYVWLYLGNAYLSNEQPAEAVKALQRVLEYPDVNRKTELRAHWDLGLAYLKLNNEDSARRHFEILQDTEDYGERVQKILQSIY